MAIVWNAISGIANSILALGVIIALFQLKALKNQNKTAQEQLKAAIDNNTTTLSQISKDHERSRRELAIDLMRAWTLSLDQKGSISRKLVETFNEAQARQLFNQEEILLISEKQKKLYAATINSPEDAGKISTSESANLRWSIIKYLNTLETIIAAWHHCVADKDIIEDQFKYLISDREGHAILAKFRMAAGGNDAYPSIQAFVDHLHKKIRAPLPGKHPTG